jgi:hypothetical protein
LPPGTVQPGSYLRRGVFSINLVVVLGSAD